jgi:hypothetical protein
MFGAAPRQRFLRAPTFLITLLELNSFTRALEDDSR